MRLTLATMRLNSASVTLLYAEQVATLIRSSPIRARLCMAEAQEDDGLKYIRALRFASAGGSPARRCPITGANYSMASE